MVSHSSSVAISAGVEPTLRRRLFGVDDIEATFARRQFRNAEGPCREHLERVGKVFLWGYNLSLDVAETDALAATLDGEAPEYRGFAYEGAAMGCALRDLLSFSTGSSRLEAFLGGPGRDHVYMAIIGAGWSWARVSFLGYGRRVGSKRLAELDPLLHWLAFDGYGFHEGYFHWPRTVNEGRRPRGFEGYAARAFDQGVGRSLWFVEGADVRGIVERVHAFPEERRADVYSGVGLAATYAGKVEDEALRWLRSQAGDHASELAQGAAFAAKARSRAQTPAEHTERACRILCGSSAQEAADVTDTTLLSLGETRDTNSFERWRQSIRQHYQQPHHQEDTSA